MEFAAGRYVVVATRNTLYGWRVSCTRCMLFTMMSRLDQLATVPPPILRKRGEFAATVVMNQLLCRAHYRLTLRVKHFPPSEPGQFVQVLCSPATVSELSPLAPFAETMELRELSWELGLPPPRFHEPYLLGSQPFLRRPFSLAGRRDDPTAGYTDIDLIYRVIGKATGRMQALQTGDSISILGPLGKEFPMPADMGLALLVGGGVGIPPMIYLAEKLQRLGIKALAFIGAQRADLMPLEITGPVTVDPTLNVHEFARYDLPCIVATDDGSLGHKGLVTEALEAYARQGLGAGGVIFCCGPTPMMRATAGVAARVHLPCYVSLEQPMACGMGTCQSCVIKYRPAGTEDWVYKLACTDGPVFNAADILW
ncbi:MAG: dihydroorotate dehydrogenase electron transfer subunit [Phycisphaerae bacterium]